MCNTRRDVFSGETYHMSAQVDRKIKLKLNQLNKLKFAFGVEMRHQTTAKMRDCNVLTTKVKVRFTLADACMLVQYIG